MRRMLGMLNREGIAKRLFMLFVACAFLPFAIVTLLSWSQVRTLLIQQGDQRLAANAKAYGMGVFERAFFASDVARSLASFRNGDAGAQVGAKSFRTLALEEGGRVIPLIGTSQSAALTPQELQRVRAGQPLLRVADAKPHARVTLVVPLPRSEGIVFGELDPRYLWGDPEELPIGMQVCVTEEGSPRPLYCSSPLDEASLKEAASQPMSGFGSAVRDIGGETFRMRTWPQFMRAGFGTDDWVVVAAQPESVLLARARDFTRLYVPTVGLALLLAVWLTIRQSRDIVQPVAQLARQARAIARNDFRRGGLKPRTDEFGELAHAFDHMSERLGRQFASLTALAEIDRLILSTQDTAEVVRTVLGRLHEMVPSDMASITLVDHDNAELGRSFIRPPEGGSAIQIERIAVEPAQREAMEQAREGEWLALDTADPGRHDLEPLRAAGMRVAYAQGITWRGAVCGTLCLGYREQPSSTTGDEQQRTSEMADRVAVAVSSAWRDEQLYVQAHFDQLTGLPNRLLFKDRLAREILHCKREDKRFAVLFIDLDHFKTVNDSYGHSTGDVVLREAARRISTAVRQSDTVARLGGDEFTVLLAALNQPQEAWLIAETIVASLSREFALAEQQCYLSASIGIASYPADGATAEELLKAADTAMYRAKAGGRSQAVFFEERMNAETVARLTLDRDLRAGIERGELVLFYQPQLDIATGAVRAAEALVRWNHPVHGMVSPQRFIPLAEESKLIEQIGEWILREAARQAGAWRAQGLPLERISVNVSPRQFRQRNIGELIRRCAMDAGLPAAALEIEITEGLLLDQGETVEGILRELAEAGHGIALDDFGTGFSSMAYLKRLPVDTIKIDRVFVDGVERSADSEAIVTAIIAMSHALGKRVVAEGVETTEQLALLRRLGCDFAQGFHVSRPLSAADFAQRLRLEQVAVA